MVRRLSLFFLAAIALASTSALAKPKESLFYSFGAPGDGLQPWGLIADKSGVLYGTTRFGGRESSGTVYSISTDGVEKIIYSFGGPNDATQPKAAPTIDKKGNFFGATTAGGTANQGAIFELIPNGASYTEKVLYSFCSLTDCADGRMAASSLVIGPNGELYGTTPFGGMGSAQQDGGVIFRLDPPGKHQTTWTETVLHTFCSQASCADGINPNNAPVLTNDGFLYGTAYGVLYRLKTDGSDFEVVHTFPDSGGDGESAEASLTVDSTGLLYGTTGRGGMAGCGTVFSLNPSSLAYSKVYDFNCTDEQGPISGVTIVKTKTATTFYGTLVKGTVGPFGAIYSLVKPAQEGDPWTEQVIHDFCKKELCPDGGYPMGDKLVNIKSTIYGTTISGGDNGDGVIFKYGRN